MSKTTELRLSNYYGTVTVEHILGKYYIFLGDWDDFDRDLGEKEYKKEISARLYNLLIKELSTKTPAK